MIKSTTISLFKSLATSTLIHSNPSFNSYRFLSSTTLSSSSSTSSTPSTSTSSESTLPKEPKLLSYFIKRSSSGSLPVYAEIKEGGAKTFTIIRKIDGSLEAFREDLKKHLPTAITKIKQSSRQVVITGNWVKETKEYLSAGGF